MGRVLPLIAALLLLHGLSQTSENGYVAANSCQPCHSAIYATYQQNGMGRSFAPIHSVPLIEDWTAKFQHAASNREYTVVRRDGRFFMRRTKPELLEKEIHYVIGSGNHSRTYLTRKKNGKLAELPLSWYADNGGHWAMSPGYDRPGHSDFRREVPDSCLFCHTAYPSPSSNAIDCQRCHGPGADHVTRPAKNNIVNPARLSRERQAEICLQCHLESASRHIPDSIRRFERTPFSYRPGEPLGNFQIFFDAKGGADRDIITVNHSAYGMRRSACYQKSELLCTTCHNPHEARRGAAAYTATCRTCHPSVHPDKPAGECVDCHMPKRRTSDAVHVVVTDHWIRRHPPRDDTAPRQEHHGRYNGPVQPYLPANNEEPLYLALAALTDKARLPQAVRELEKAIQQNQPQHAEWYLRLARALRDSGSVAKARHYYREALKRRPFLPAAATELADLLPPPEAITLLENNNAARTGDPALLNALAVSYSRAGRFTDAEPLLRKAIDLDEDLPVSWLNLGVSLEALGKPQQAALAYREALRLQPDFAQARQYWNRLHSPSR